MTHWETWWREVATSDPPADQDPYEVLVHGSATWRRLWDQFQHDVSMWTNDETSLFTAAATTRTAPGGR